MTPEELRDVAMRWAPGRLCIVPEEVRRGNAGTFTCQHYDAANASRIASAYLSQSDTIERLQRENAAHDLLEKDCLAEIDSLNQQVTDIEAAIREHRDQKADDRCWEDDQKLYAVLGDGNLGDNTTCDPCVMLANCKRFIERRMQGGSWPSYQELERENAVLRESIALCSGSCRLPDGSR